MKIFTFEINKNVKLSVEETNNCLFTLDDFDVFLTIGSVRYFIHKDSLFYDIMLNFQQAMGEKHKIAEAAIEKGELLSKLLYKKGQECFDSPLYENVLFFSNSYMIILVPYKDGKYLEVAKVNVNEGEGSYKLIMHKKISYDVSMIWQETLNELQNFAKNNHDRLFNST